MEPQTKEVGVAYSEAEKVWEDGDRNKDSKQTMAREIKLNRSIIHKQTICTINSNMGGLFSVNGNMAIQNEELQVILWKSTTLCEGEGKYIKLSLMWMKKKMMKK